MFTAIGCASVKTVLVSHQNSLYSNLNFGLTQFLMLATDVIYLPRETDQKVRAECSVLRL